jgi:hypothetical protein
METTRMKCAKIGCFLMAVLASTAVSQPVEVPWALTVIEPGGSIIEGTGSATGNAATGEAFGEVWMDEPVGLFWGPVVWKVVVWAAKIWHPSPAFGVMGIGEASNFDLSGTMSMNFGAPGTASANFDFTNELMQLTLDLQNLVGQLPDPGLTFDVEISELITPVAAGEAAGLGEYSFNGIGGQPYDVLYSLDGNPGALIDPALHLFSGSGAVDIDLQHFAYDGIAEVIPVPGTLSLLALSGLLVTRRRR